MAEPENGGMVARKRVVETGESYNNLVEIISGLNPGEKVVVFGFQNLGNGQPIAVNGT